MFQLLFISSGNSGVSLIAGSLIRNKKLNYLNVTCASETVSNYSSDLKDAVSKYNIETNNLGLQPLTKIESKPFDLVVKICNYSAAEKPNCLEFPKAPPVIHWHIPEMNLLNGKNTGANKAVGQIVQSLEHKMEHLVNDGYLDAIRNQHQVFTSLLENMIDGILAHDKNRKILFFNQAAQRITGYSYEEVINKDCHDVFPGRFCGGNCSFCDSFFPGENRTKYFTTFRHKNGLLRDFEMSSIQVENAPANSISSLVIFKDVHEDDSIKIKKIKFQGFQGIISQNPLMEKIFDTIREVANINVPVMIQGESGTGKEMVANAIHRLSSRVNEPFVPVNCGALPEGTLESELFGHVKGAFTGAIRDKKGRFELADKGTIFLDEVGELSPAMQVKLLRVLQDGSFTHVGGEEPVSVDVRIICATNRDIKDMMQKGEFREDLYYRLMVVPIFLPPLRNKKVDIPLLIDYFLDKFSRLTGKSIKRISPEARNCLLEYSWPGNIRELANTIQYALIKCHNSVLNIEHFPDEITERSPDSMHKKLTRKNPHLKIEDVIKVLNNTGGNKSKAASLLGVSRPTLYNYLGKMKL